MLSLYAKYYADRNFEFEDVFREINAKYSVERVMYPGSFVHITPSFVFGRVVYVDSDRQAAKFFNNVVSVKELINSRRRYAQEPEFTFFGQDYSEPLPVEEDSFDLLISHYAGIISQPCKRYLKFGGLLLVNNSHADAGVAHLDPEFTLIATINFTRKPMISADKLSDYFVPKKNPSATKDELCKNQKGLAYTRSADLYVFRKTGDERF